MPCYSDIHTQTKEKESGKILHAFFYGYNCQSEKDTILVT